MPIFASELLKHGISRKNHSSHLWELLLWHFYSTSNTKNKGSKVCFFDMHNLSISLLS